MKKPSRKSRRKPPDIRIGTSGWSYVHWRKVFYPEDLPAPSWFGYYSRYFDTVEVKNTFRDLPDETTFAKWHADAPPQFVFSVKASRHITHVKKLKNVDAALSLFLERVSGLKRQLGPLLFQLPPDLKYDAARLEDFLDLLPSRKRYVIEVRHRSWLNDGMADLLSRRKVAFCIHDHFEEKSPAYITANFSYFRFHGHSKKYGDSYPKRVLTSYAETMAKLLDSGKDVFAYFNNDASGRALKNAVSLRKILASIMAA
jgi:uncharacterized protein YecE (DUF72 family)